MMMKVFPAVGLLLLGNVIAKEGTTHFDAQSVTKEDVSIVFQQRSSSFADESESAVNSSFFPDSSRFLQQGDLDVCENTSCCIDCVCCGPGTQWNGQMCILLDGSGSLACAAQTAIENSECFSEWTCLGDACCGQGTQSVVDPARDAPACHCVPEDDSTTTPTASPSGSDGTDSPTYNPTVSPTSPPSGEPCAIDITVSQEFEDATETGCVRNVLYSVELCHASQGVTYLSRPTLEISLDGTAIDSVEFPVDSSENFLCCGLCFSEFYQYSSTVDVCIGGEYLVTFSVDGERDSGFGVFGSCSESGSLVLNF
jgi:hypothetical protein